MTDLFKTATSLFMTPECYDEYFVNLNFFHGKCIKATISKALGLIIIAGSVTVKVPQILKIINHKSGEGISTFGVLLDLIAITSFFSYNYIKQFPFSAWGEGLFLAIQTIAVYALILYYKKQRKELVAVVGIYFTSLFFLLSGVVPVNVMWFMQIMNLPLVMLGKGSQILANHKNRSTGNLSLITSGMQFGGSMARVFTSIQETGDMANVLCFIVTTILNGSVALQFFLYGKPSGKKKGKGKGKGKGKKSE